MKEENKRLKEAGPSVAVRLLGLNGIPEAGIEFSVVENEKAAREMGEARAFTSKQEDQEVRAKVARGLLHSRPAMLGSGFDLLLDHIADGGRGSELWRTVPRLIRFGEPRRALRLTASLAIG